MTWTVTVTKSSRCLLPGYSQDTGYVYIVPGFYDFDQTYNIFDEFPADEIGLTPLKFEHAAWCNACEGMTSAKTCPHPGSEKIFLSGTKVRELLAEGERPPMEFSRPEVADVLIAWARSESPVAS